MINMPKNTFIFSIHVLNKTEQCGILKNSVNYVFCTGHSLPSADSRRAVVSFWQKNVHNTG